MKSGFTLIELLSVIVIISILAGLLLVGLNLLLEQRNRAVTLYRMKDLAQAVTLYLGDNTALGGITPNTFASNPQKFLTDNPLAAGQDAYYPKTSPLIDGWKRPFKFFAENTATLPGSPPPGDRFSLAGIRSQGPNPDPDGFVTGTAAELADDLVMIRGKDFEWKTVRLVSVSSTGSWITQP
ncbi:hypothetical protein LBMAG53_22350 [Planctomycetota bacterium]|nr:hypothetical protein LBMAG53_22350 [Planctomycetota bacterium]